MNKEGGSEAAEKPDCGAEVSKQVGDHKQQSYIILINVR